MTVVEKSKTKPLTSAERSRRFRDKLKNDPTLYQAYREFETARVSAYRQNMSEDKKKEYNEKTKIRMTKYREKKKMDGGSSTHSKPKKPVTRAERELQRVKWREAKRISRLNMTGQKRRRINEKEELHTRQKTKQECTKKNTKDDSTSSFNSDSARRKAVSRIKSRMPSSPRKYSIIVSSLISNTHEATENENQSENQQPAVTDVQENETVKDTDDGTVIIIEENTESDENIIIVENGIQEIPINIDEKYYRT
ncbi:unnamed protein product [Mytilus coruscus]|uniref:Uncharacterized protein n=1 Tax=Mytilus coruscus TaxID=42192 RepID=A0A6J8ELU3_MYTCO|nr:unnamed protein product [Mytilus coruscus]